MITINRFEVALVILAASAGSGAAVGTALGQVSSLFLGAHIEGCVAGALSSGSEHERRKKIDELLKVIRPHGTFGA